MALKSSGPDSFICQTASFFAASICFSKITGMSIQVAKLKEFRGHTQAIYTMAASGKPGYFYSAGADGMVVLWHIEEDDGLLVARSEQPVYSICKTDTYLLFGSNNGLLTVLQADNHQLVKQLIIGESPIFDIVHHEEKIYLA